jgi:hypothetical protein
VSRSFPRKDWLRRGALLGCIVNATMTAESEDYAPSAQWERGNYFRDGRDGRYGAVTFRDSSLVGAFYDAKSDRTPFRCEGGYDPAPFLRGMPAAHRALLERVAFGYLQLQVDEKVIPCFTAAFWDEGEYLAAAEHWDEVLRNGADLIRIEVLEDLEAAYAEWQNEYQMTPEQVAFVRSVFTRKWSRSEAVIELTHGEARWLESLAKTPEATKACRESFAGMGIILP